MINKTKNIKINRFILKLVNEGVVFADKRMAYEIYFSHSPLTKEPNIRYDRDRRCYYFDTMEEALQARQHLKEHFDREIKSGKMSGSVPLYDVMSEMIPWYDCDFDSKRLQDVIENGKGIESVIVPEFMQGVEELLEELEKEDSIEFQKENHGDTDEDALDFAPTLNGKDAIAIARTGVGQLMFVRDGVRIPITPEEAEAIAKVTPDSIYLYKNGSKAGSVEF